MGKREWPRSDWFKFTSDWLRGWREFSRPIKQHSKAKPIQSWITFNTQLKIALTGKKYWPYKWVFSTANVMEWKAKVLHSCKAIAHQFSTLNYISRNKHLKITVWCLFCSKLVKNDKGNKVKRISGWKAFKLKVAMVSSAFL